MKKLVMKLICYFLGCTWEKIDEYNNTGRGDKTEKRECKRCHKIEYWEVYVPKFHRKLHKGIVDKLS